jgi:hypothetical protein
VVIKSNPRTGGLGLYVIAVHRVKLVLSNIRRILKARLSFAQYFRSLSSGFDICGK